MVTELQAINSKFAVNFVLVTSKHARSGKDTLVDIMYTQHKKRKFKENGETQVFFRERFAKPVIDSFELIFGHKWDQEKHIPGIRQKLITYATLVEEIDLHVWIKRTMKDVGNLCNAWIKNPPQKGSITIFFTDCRYQYEYDFLKELLAALPVASKSIILVEVFNRGQDNIITDRSHPKEAIRQKPDYLILNSKKSLGEYEKEILKQIGHIIE